jgi:hypothetical protein
MNKLVLPGQQISIQRSTGEIDATWYERLRAMLDQLNNLSGGGGGGGGTVTLTGDVTGSGIGTIPTTTGKLQNHAVSSTAPTPNQVLKWTGTAWTPQTLTSGQMTWVPYTTLGQAFVAQNLTRDGDWTMVANTSTTDRPAPQPSGAEEDLLPAWTPTRQQASGSYIVYNEWTTNTAGWIDQYGVDIIQQNVNKSHIITLRVNGVVRDTFTATPNTAELYWHDITPIVTTSGAVIRVTLQIAGTGSNSWYQQIGLFATPPVYCSLAQGAKDAGAPGTTAYGCHLLFTPGTASPNWDVVAYGGAAAGGGVGPAGPNVVYIQDTHPTGASPGELWWNSANGQLYVNYNDGATTQWVSASNNGGGGSSGGSGGSTLYVQDVKPMTAPANSMWWNSKNGQLYINYNDGSMMQWVSASNNGGAGSLLLMGFQKAGAPASGDLPSGTMGLINDTSGGQTWLCYNSAGTIRKVQLT